MEPPSGQQGEVLIRTKFNCGGLVRADKSNFSLSWQEMISNEAFQQAVSMSEGPHCLVPDQLDVIY